jgi:hypothetical protein
MGGFIMAIIQLASDTLAVSPASGQIEYDGQLFYTDSTPSRAQVQRIVRGTAQASTSGTAITFSSIPAWVERITVMFNGVSTSGTSNIQIQVGSGSVTTTGYASSASLIGATSVLSTSATSGFLVTANESAAYLKSGAVTILNLTGNIWVSSGTLGLTAAGGTFPSGGNSPSLAGALDRVVITTVNGTDTFDAGSINIMYEG